MVNKVTVLAQPKRRVAVAAAERSLSSFDVAYCTANEEDEEYGEFEAKGVPQAVSPPEKACGRMISMISVELSTLNRKVKSTS
jgi:hypothetical protein